MVDWALMASNWWSVSIGKVSSVLRFALLKWHLIEVKGLLVSLLSFDGGNPTRS